ncbi:MAG: type VI secretion system contractile sheath large subunit [Bryobacteraceae bacterium]
MMSGRHPFVVAVLADLSGQQPNPLPMMKNRRFVTVTKNSISTLFRHLRPAVRLSAPIPNSDGNQDVLLRFGEATPFARESITAELSVQRFDPELAAMLADFVLSSEQYQNLTGTWESIRWLVEQLGNEDMYRVIVLDVTKRDVLRDVQRAPNVEDCAMYKKLFAQAAGTFGGEPVRCVLCDFELTHSPEDGDLAGSLASLGAAANVPIISGIEAAGSFDDMRPCRPREATRLLKTDEWEFLFPVLPRFKAEVLGPTPSWSADCHPRAVYLVGAETAKASSVRPGPERVGGTSVLQLRPLCTDPGHTSKLRLWELLDLCKLCDEIQDEVRRLKRPLVKPSDLRTKIAAVILRFGCEVFEAFDIETYVDKMELSLVWNQERIADAGSTTVTIDLTQLQ